MTYRRIIDSIAILFRGMCASAARSACHCDIVQAGNHARVATRYSRPPGNSAAGSIASVTLTLLARKPIGKTNQGRAASAWAAIAVSPESTSRELLARTAFG